MFAALRVVTTRNPVHAALWLVLSFFTAAGIWLLLQAEFLAIALVLVYVGAVMVLFLFVVMMLDVNFDNLRAALPQLRAARRAGRRARAARDGAGDRRQRHRPGHARCRRRPPGSNTQALGRLLYTDYVYPFEIAAVILLVAIVAAIALTHRQRKETKYQEPGDAGEGAPRRTACASSRCRRKSADALVARPSEGEGESRDTSSPRRRWRITSCWARSCSRSAWPASSSTARTSSSC